MVKAAAIVAVLAVAACLPAALADASFVASTCKSTDNAQCVAVLSTDPRSARATTVRDLASIGLDIAAANAKDSHGYLNGEAEKRDRTSAGDALEDCARQYEQAVVHLETARENFDAGEFSDAEKETDAAEDAADQCEQAFTDRHLESTVSGVDKRMKDRASVASDLIDLLWTVKGSGRRRLLRS